MWDFVQQMNGETSIWATKKAAGAAAFCEHVKKVIYSAFTFSACQPLGPLTTSN